jgi:hypothetical protein
LPRQARRARAALDCAVTASQLTYHRQIHWRELATDDVAAGWQDLAGRARRSDSLSSQVRRARAALRGEANPHYIQAAQKYTVAQTDTRERLCLPGLVRAGPREGGPEPYRPPASSKCSLAARPESVCLRTFHPTAYEPESNSAAPAALLSRSAPLRPCQCPNQILFLYKNQILFLYPTKFCFSERRRFVYTNKIIPILYQSSKIWV